MVKATRRVRRSFGKWLSGLKPVTGADTMLRFTKTPEGSIDLTHAHPSGLAQLMAGRRTRLSTLIRDQQQYVVAARASRNIRSKIFELANDRGIDAGYLSAGTVVWTSAVGRQTAAGFRAGHAHRDLPDRPSRAKTTTSCSSPSRRTSIRRWSGT